MITQFIFFTDVLPFWMFSNVFTDFHAGTPVVENIIGLGDVIQKVVSETGSFCIYLDYINELYTKAAITFFTT